MRLMSIREIPTRCSGLLSLSSGLAAHSLRSSDRVSAGRISPGPSGLGIHRLRASRRHSTTSGYSSVPRSLRLPPPQVDNCILGRIPPAGFGSAFHDQLLQTYRDGLKVEVHLGSLFSRDDDPLANPAESNEEGDDLLLSHRYVLDQEPPPPPPEALPRPMVFSAMA